MLSALELYLLPLVDAALPAAVEVVRGPFVVAPPWPANRQVVCLHAVQLTVQDVPPPRTNDRPASSFQLTTWPINGVNSSFTLPPAMVGVIAEVEAPVGYLATPGEDYYLDGSTIRFFHAPTGPGLVRARVQVAAAAGRARRSPGVITVDVSSHSRSIDTAEPNFGGALQQVLVELERAPYLELPPVAGLGTSVRFRDFRSHLLSIERLHSGYENVVSCIARLELVGELDVLVAIGAPEPVDVIARLEGEVVVEGAIDGSAEPLEIAIEASEGGP